MVVVDNASGDDTREVVESSPGSVRFFPLSQNHGFGAGCNVGVRAATHDAVVLLNPDTVLVDDSLRRLGELALARRALCGPRLVNQDGSVQPSASAAPGGWERVVRAVVPPAALPRSLRERCDPWRAERTRPVAWLTGACIAAPRDVLLRLGPFDESLHLFGEDIDLGLRARAAGIPNLFAPDIARVVHLDGTAARRRFADAGLRATIETRLAVVSGRFGRRRAALDLLTDVVFHVGRFLAKRPFGRGAAEAAWLRAFAGLVREATTR